MLERSGDSFFPVFFQRRAAPACENRTMPPHTLPRSASALFSHVMADNAPLYRAILDVFAASKRQFRLHLRPDDVLAEATWPGGPPSPRPWPVRTGCRQPPSKPCSASSPPPVPDCTITGISIGLVWSSAIS